MATSRNSPPRSELQPPHVVFFNRSYYPDTSATGQLLTELCESLKADYGWRVSVVTGVPLLPSTPVRGGLLGGREEHNGVEILRAGGTRFSKSSLIGRISNYVSYFASACLGGLFLDRPQVIVCLTDPPIIGLAGYLAGRRFHCPLVMAYNDVFPEVARLLEDFKSPLIEAILERANRFLARNADRVVVLGATMRKRLVAKGAPLSQTAIIPSWADSLQIYPADKRNPFSAEHHLQDKFVVMHSGNLGLSQGLEVLIEAAAQLMDFPDIEVVLVGEGVKKPELQERARQLGLPNVKFLPFQPKESLVHSFAAADVFVVTLKKGLAGYIVPSKTYGILAAGRPYVAAVEEEAEITEITRRYGCGLLARVGDSRHLAEQILRLYEDPGMRQQMGERAYQAAAEFDRPVQMQAYHDLLKDLIQKRQAELPTPFFKRSFDLVLSGLGLILSSPLWLLIAVAIKLGDGGKVFYGQQRVGRSGKVFRSWKFRSMVPESDRDFGPLAASREDPRITRVGKLLRATAMDELPQLWNIFIGQMSFVGPRALMPLEIAPGSAGAEPRPLSSVRGYQERHRVTPGLTGIAQIFRPRDISPEFKFRLDRLYIRKRSFWLDLRLILLSFWITFRANWETRGDKLA